MCVKYLLPQFKKIRVNIGNLGPIKISALLMQAGIAWNYPVSYSLTMLFRAQKQAMHISTWTRVSRGKQPASSLLMTDLPSHKKIWISQQRLSSFCLQYLRRVCNMRLCTYINIVHNQADYKTAVKHMTFIAVSKISYTNQQW